MPTLSTTTTLSLPAGQMLVFETGGAGTATADPGGRSARYALGGVRAEIGPWASATSVLVEVASGTLFYSIDTDGSAAAPRIVISSEAPNNADGRPDGTVYLQTA